MNGDVLPLVYILIERISKESYKRLLLKLKNFKPALSPSTVMTNFERAAINAFKAVFPCFI